MRMKNKKILSLLSALSIHMIGCATAQPPLDLGSTHVLREDKKSVAILNFKQAGRLLIRDGSAEVVSPKENFTSVAMYSDKRGFVISQENGLFRYAHYNSQTKELTKLPKEVQVWIEPGLPSQNDQRIVTAVSYDGRQNHRQPQDIQFYSSYSAAPIVIKDLFPPPEQEYMLSSQNNSKLLINRFNNYLVAHSRENDGKTPRSQVLNLAGQAISPFIATVRNFPTVADINSRQFQRPSESGAFFVGRFEGQRFNGLEMWQPLDDLGTPLKLPGDVVGAIPIQLKGAWNAGWILLYATPEGPEGILHYGSIFDFKGPTSSTPRIKDAHFSFSRYNKNMVNILSQTLDGKWHINEYADPKYVEWVASAPANINLKALQAYFAVKEKEKAAQDLAADKIYAEKNKAVFEAEYKKKELRRQNFAKSPNVCGLFFEALNLGPESINRFLKECELNSDEHILLASKAGADVSLISSAQQKLKKKAESEAYREEQRKQRMYSNSYGGLLEHLRNTSGPALVISPGGTAASGFYGQQQQRYEWQKQLNRQLYGR